MKYDLGITKDFAFRRVWT